MSGTPSTDSTSDASHAAATGAPFRIPEVLAAANRTGGRKRSFRDRAVNSLLRPFRTVLGNRLPRRFGILMYHRVVDAVPGVPFPTWNVTPARFREQLGGLLELGFRAWPLRRVLEAARNGEPVPSRTFVVTFDDGYRNNFTRAWPVLRDLGVPATIFVSTAYLDSDRPFPNDDWCAAGSSGVPREMWEPLCFDECRTLLADGLVDIGTHTHTHADFRGRPEALRDELVLSQRILRERLDVREPTFAFPYGVRRLGFSGPPLSTAAREAGVLCSLTTEAESCDPAADPFEWGRFVVEQHDSAGSIAVKLDGWYDLARDAWRLLRGRRGPPRAASRPSRDSVAVEGSKRVLDVAVARTEEACDLIASSAK